MFYALSDFTYGTYTKLAFSFIFYVSVQKVYMLCSEYMFMNKLNETSLFVEDVEIYQKQEGVSIHVTHVEASTFLKLL